MSTTVKTSEIVAGTVKVGRWTYPAQQDADATIRNTKRDGSGEWVEVDSALFVPDAPTAGGAPKPGTKAAKPRSVKKVATPADKADVETPDRTALRAVHLAIYNSGIWADGTDIQVEDPAKPGKNLTEKRALELARRLVKLNLAVEEKATKDTGFKAGQPIWMSTPNWDEVDEAESLAIFERTVPFDIVVPVHVTRADKPVNNTHAKPGRSSWAVGTPCPQGHTLEEGDVYVMPSGRRQCRKCRKGYPSNI